MSDLDLIARLDRGLPLSALHRVSDRIAPSDKAFRYRIVPRATLGRLGSRQAQAVLSPEQGAKVARLAKLWALAVEVWKDEDEARAFLWRSHPLLEGRSPIDMALASEFGGPLVEGLLRQLQYSSAA